MVVRRVFGVAARGIAKLIENAPCRRMAGDVGEMEKTRLPVRPGKPA